MISTCVRTNENSGATKYGNAEKYLIVDSAINFLSIHMLAIEIFQLNFV